MEETCAPSMTAEDTDAAGAGVRRKSDAPPLLGVRVAYLVNQYPKVSHSFIRREIHALEALGCDVERISVRRVDETLADPADRREAELTHVILGRGALPLLRAVVGTAVTAPRRWLASLRLAWRLGRRSDRGRLRHLVYFAEACVCLPWLREAGAQHIHAHFGTNSAMVAMLIHALGGSRYSFTVHGPEEFDKPEFIALGEKIRRAAFTIAISDFGKSQLYRQVEYDHWRKIAVVRCGVDQRFLGAPVVPAPTAPRLVCVGRLCEQKGQSLLVEAAAQLVAAGRELELVLVGDGPMRPQIEELIQRAGLRGSIRITGWLGEAEVLREIVSARALVLPSFAEGLPVVIMEALALGRPVIVTRIAGIPELVEDGTNGWLVTAGSVDQLVHAMGEALGASPELLDRLGAAGRKRVLAQHDAHAEGAKLGGQIARAIAERPPEAR